MSDKLMYTTFDSVKIRLVNKVQFQAVPDEVADGELPNSLLEQLIRDAETEIEMKLRSRYAVPFSSITNGTFCGLPDHTKRAIRKVVDLQAVLFIMGTDFGRGTHITAEGYVDQDAIRLKNEINTLLGMDAEGSDRDRYRFSPPLDDLMLAPTNSEADDGFKGMLINTDANTHGAEIFAEEHINNPSQSYLSRPLPRGGY